MVWAPQMNKPRWVKLGDLQPPRPPEPSGRVVRAQRQAEKAASPLFAYAGKPCGYCSVAMTLPPQWNTTAEPTAATRDHAFPKAKGWHLGHFDGANRVVCCYKCNQAKGANDIVDWFVRLHAGRDPRATIVLQVVVALEASAAILPATVRAKLRLAHEIKQQAAVSLQAYAIRVKEMGRAGTANQGQAPGGPVAS
jgi:hypothetical protein